MDVAEDLETTKEINCVIQAAYAQSMEDLAVLAQNIQTLNRQNIQAYIQNAEEIMLANPDRIELPVKHHFSKSVYAREIFIPKGFFLVGKIHKHENLNILSKGDISVFSVDGCVRVQAPFTIVSTPGVKRLAYAHEDCVWTTIHGTDETDVDKIEEQFIAKDYDEVVSVETKETKWLGE